MTPLPVVAIVLVAALCHAGWNAIVKSGSDTFLSTVLVAAGAAVIAGAVLPFVKAPDPASWPFIAASVTAQVVYMALLAATYRTGDLSLTYPLMRGTAPLLVALASGPVIGEGLSAGRWLGVTLICAGVAGMALARPATAPRNWLAPSLALLNAAVIASYTLLDGLGVRLSHAPAAYALYTFMLDALPLLVWTALRHGRAMMAYAEENWHVAAIGGAGTLASYSIALWAMTVAPVAVIASLRETSVLFAVAISWFVLKERIAPARLAATALIAAGAAVIRVG